MLIARDSGIVVPAAVADRAPGTGTAYDPDGRRRVVLTDSERRQVDRVIRLLRDRGLGLVVVCREERRDDGRAACGQPLRPEEVGTADPGYGCLCTRVHVGK